MYVVCCASLNSDMYINWDYILFIIFCFVRGADINLLFCFVAAQFTFNRERDINLSSYMEEGIPEEEDESDHEPLNDSGRDNIKLSDVERGYTFQDHKL